MLFRTRDDPAGPLVRGLKGGVVRVSKETQSHRSQGECGGSQEKMKQKCCEESE